MPHLSRMKQNAEFITATRVSSGMYTAGDAHINLVYTSHMKNSTRTHFLNQSVILKQEA